MGVTKVRISITEIVKTEFNFPSEMRPMEALGAIIDVTIGGGLVFGGENCKKTGVNQYLVPLKKYNTEEPYSIYSYYVHKDFFRFFRLFIDHVNVNSRQVTLDLFFADINDIKSN